MAIAIFSSLAIAWLIRARPKSPTRVNKVTHITPHFAVMGALQEGDFAEIAAAGFNLDAVRDELESLRDPSYYGPIPPALDAHG